MGKRLFVFFQELWKSIISFDFYRGIPERPLGSVIRYFAGLLILYTLVIMLFIGPGIVMGITAMSDWLVRNLPRGEIVNGEINFPKLHEPWQRTEGKVFIFVINTKDPTVSLSDEYPYGVLVKKDHIFIKFGKFMQEYQFPKNRSILVTEENIFSWGIGVILISIVIFSGINLLSIVVSKSLQSLFFAGLIFLLMKIRSRAIEYATIWKIAAYAMGAPLLLSLAVIFIGIQIPFFWMIYLAFYMVFILGALNSVMKDRLPVK